MSVPEPVPGHVSAPVPMTPRDRLENRLEVLLPGPDNERKRWLILGDADEYAAWMGEQIARPPEHEWGPQ